MWLPLGLSLLLLPGCILSRMVDRAFIGMTVRTPTQGNRKAAGLFLLPFTAAIDLVSFPIQALLLVIIGDEFPFQKANQAIGKDDLDAGAKAALMKNPGLSPAALAHALSTLPGLVQTTSPDEALALDSNGNWVKVQLTGEARKQALARAGALTPTAP